MGKYADDNVRNIMLVSHSGAGKTSLVEAILNSQGMTSRLGSVAEGNTKSDYDPIEIERKISINLSVLHFITNNIKINLLDTPGYADFINELLAAVPAANAALLLVSGYDGIEVGTQRAWDILERESVPRAIVITKLDKENSDFFKTLEEIRGNFGKKCIPVFLPAGKEANFKAIADIIAQAGMDKLDADLKDRADKFKEGLIELVAEVDDALIEKYLNGDELSADEISRTLRRAIKENKIVPVFCINALNSIGIKELVGFILEYFPRSNEGCSLKALDVKTKEEIQIESGLDKPFSGFVFKTISDPYVGQLSVFRVVSGTLNSNSEFFNVSKDTVERFGQLYVLQGKEQLPAESICSGDIAAVAKLKNTQTGDSLCEAKNAVIFKPTVKVEAAISYSLKPKTRQDEEKISQSLAKLTMEDKGIKVSRDAQTKELIISGMGDLHLEITIARLKSRYNVDVDVGTPKVPYKETIKKTARIQGKYKRQSGGRGQYGDVWLEIEPLAHGQQFEFLNKIVGGVVPRQYIPSVEKGVLKAMEEGALAGYPLVDIRVTIYDGSYHTVDSSDMAFQIAAGMALRKGVLEAGPVLLEPIMDADIVVPEDCMGAVSGDLSSRRGRVQGMDVSGKYEIIKAQVPLAEMLKYATDLRSMTSGRASYAMKFSHYEEVPQRIAEKVIAQSKIEKED
ncbi:MAG: elongation factor G [Candidatus Omnitrophica bacterium]|nr:elongation factor G [Candidatus Omnitrophota bacterium]MBU1924445.1 elongation factor G [Candidatus Omnitrophota bacterium]